MVGVASDLLSIVRTAGAASDSQIDLGRFGAAPAKTYSASGTAPSLSQASRTLVALGGANPV